CLVLDNLSRGHDWLVKGKAPLIRGDIGDESLFSATLKDFKPDAILHYAAFALVGESVAQPDLYYLNNVLSTKKVLDVLRQQAPTVPLVFSSSCAVFGSPRHLPVSEDLPLAPESPYGRTK